MERGNVLSSNGTLQYLSSSIKGRNGTLSSALIESTLKQVIYMAGWIWPVAGRAGSFAVVRWLNVCFMRRRSAVSQRWLLANEGNAQKKESTTQKWRVFLNRCAFEICQYIHCGKWKGHLEDSNVFNSAKSIIRKKVIKNKGRHYLKTHKNSSLLHFL